MLSNLSIHLEFARLFRELNALELELKLLYSSVEIKIFKLLLPTLLATTTVCAISPAVEAWLRYPRSCVK